MIERKVKEESTFFSRLSETFENGQLEYSPSERKVLQEAFFRFVQVGDVGYVKKWLDEKWADILACDKNGQNVLQIFCNSVGLPENRWKEVDFNPQKELSEKELYLYDVLNTHYKVALERNIQEQIEALRKQIGTRFVFPRQVLEDNKLSILSVLCVFPKKSLFMLKDVLEKTRLSKRQIVRTRRFFRKIIPSISQKSRTN